MKTSKHLSANGLFELVRHGFQKTKDHQPMNVQIPLVDAFMSGFAMFRLKRPILVLNA